MIGRLAAAALLAAFALASTPSAAPQRAEAPPPLRVLNWSDYMPEDVLAAFEAETGVAVEHAVYDSGEVAESVLLAGGGGYDLVVVSSEYLQRLAAEDVIGPFDPDRLPGLAGVDPMVAGALAALDPDGRAVPYLYGTTGLAYDRAAVLARMPDAPLDSWSMVFDPTIVSRFADCGVALVDAPEEILAAALLWLGRDPNAATAADIDAAFAVVEAAAPHVSAIDSALMEPFSAGAFCVAVAWSTDAASAAADASPGVSFAYREPAEGALLWFDLFVMPRGARSPDAAHAFVDFLLRPEISARVAEYSWVASPVAAARRLMSPEVADHAGVFPDLRAGRLLALGGFTATPKHALLERWLSVKLMTRP